MDAQGTTSPISDDYGDAGRGQVLLIVDQGTVLADVVASLERGGQAVTGAPSWSEALDLLSAGEVAVAVDVRHLQSSDNMIRQLLAEVTEAEEAERLRIAHLIHDEVIQAVAAARLRVELLGTGLDEAAAQRHLEAMNVLREVAVRLRRLLVELAPLEIATSSFASGLSNYLGYVSDEDGVRIVHNDALEIEPPAPLAILIYRAVQELVSNVRAHAQASAIWVDVDGDADMWRVSVRDDGLGISEADAFDPSSGGVGLRALRERLARVRGTISVDRHQDGGTIVTCSIPRSAVG